MKDPLCDNGDKVPDIRIAVWDVRFVYGGIGNPIYVNRIFRRVCL